MKRQVPSVTQRPIRVIVADDHPIFREGLVLILDTQPDIVVIGEFENGEDTLYAVCELAPDVAVLYAIHEVAQGRLYLSRWVGISFANIRRMKELTKRERELPLSPNSQAAARLPTSDRCQSL